MRSKKITCLLFNLIFFGSLSISSQDYSEFNYVAPLDIPMILSGNFGEFRSNHFHTGIDIKTQGVQGKKIFSVADGTISRIKISPNGYGKALYIDHPDGNTSVYAHMKSFTDEIESYMLKQQYLEKTYEINFYPDSGVFNFQQGDIIGLSGNTGHSGGPHLHFEIRDTKTEHPLNPLLFGFDIKDGVKPILRGIRIYPIGSGSSVDGQSKEKSYTLKSIGKGTYQLEKDTIFISGEFGIGVHTIDKMINANNTYSVYRLRLKMNNEVIYSHVMNRLDFETSRYLNSHMDYALFKRNKWRYHKCFPAANNQLDIYELLSTTQQLNEGESANILVEAADIDGNNVSLEFVISGTSTKEVPVEDEEEIKFYALKDNSFENENIRVTIPAYRLYDNTNLIFKEIEAAEKNKSNTFTIGTSMEGLQEEMFLTVKLKPQDSGNNKIKLYKSGKKGRFKLCDSEVRENYVHGSSKEFGQFVLKEDASSPTITTKKFPKIASAKNSSISFSISDNLSGVKSINAYVDGEWLMMKHNVSMSYASGLLSQLDLPKGEHEFKLVVEDACENQKIFTKKFIWQ